MLGVLLHVIGDAINNIGVIITALIIWKTSSKNRFYADPAVSMFIAIMVLLSSLPLVKYSGAILLQTAPQGVSHDDVKWDLERIPGVVSVHELHIWRLDQKKTIASAHIVVADEATMRNFMEIARVVGECLHAYGIHSATLQPEISGSDDSHHDHHPSKELGGTTLRRIPSACSIRCGTICHELTCCKL